MRLKDIEQDRLRVWLRELQPYRYNKDAKIVGKTTTNISKLMRSISNIALTYEDAIEVVAEMSENKTN